MPAASAAAIWPVKMASGKFQGEMQAKTPRPCNSSALVSPTGPLQDRGARELPLGQKGIVAAEVGRLAHFAHRVGQGLAGFAHRQRDQAVAMLLQRVGHGAQDAGAVGAAARVPGRLRLGGGGEGGVDLGLAGFGAVADFG